MFKDRKKLQSYSLSIPRVSVNLSGRSETTRPDETMADPQEITSLIRQRTLWALCALCLVTAVIAPAQTFTSLVSFDGTDGSDPYTPLVQGADGDLYGAAYAGGANGSGEVFKMGSTGVLTVLYSFCTRISCDDGAAPDGGLALGTNEDFYGTTSESGAYLAGTLFKITSTGQLTNLHAFCSPPHCTDGAYPHGALALSSNGDFYGTASGGGYNSAGTVFSMTAGGVFSVLYAFCSKAQCADGEDPEAGLTLGTNGLFYGTTHGGGASNQCQGGCGTVFEVSPKGALTTLYSFCEAPKCGDGSGPLSALVEGRDGNFYGTTARGGLNNNGTVFRITPEGDFTALYGFCSQTNCADGSDPRSGLVLGTDGAFYGTTYSGGAYSNGALFRITTTGFFTVLHSFDVFDGQNPDGALFQATNGTLYGTTVFGGSSRAGTAFSLNMGLSAFVETVPVGGKAGRSVVILGTDLTGVTSVTFNGAAANFTLESNTAIQTSVPAGASTGPVQVVTPNGTLTSNMSFRVQQ
jgi:uncharacterized repeat protein (TIGR03803 family)